MDIEGFTSATSHTTSFDSNTDAVPTEVLPDPLGATTKICHLDSYKPPQSSVETSGVSTTLPLLSSEARRTSYRAILAQRLKVTVFLNSLNYCESYIFTISIHHAKHRFDIF